MKMIYALGFVFLLAGCADTIYQPVTKYPELPPIQKPQPLNLMYCKWDMPRNIDDQIVQSNVFVGLSQDDFNCLIENTEILRQQLKQYDNTIDVINTERVQWIELNKQNEPK